MSPRTGRPKSDSAKSKLLQVRMDDDDMKRLYECAEAKATTRAEIVREGIRMVHESLKDKEK